MTPRSFAYRSAETSRPRSVRRRRLALAVAAAITVAAPSVAAALSATAAIPPTPSGWSQVFGDDFTGGAGSLPSGATWQFDLGTSYPGGPPNWGTGEIQTYTNSTSNISLDGSGNLRITPLRDGAGNWTSARIETNRTDFKAPAGGVLRIEGRIQMPNVTGSAALGYWPAFWALGSPYRGNFQNWPGIGEFDIMENVNGIDSVWGVLHCGVAPGGPCNEFTGIGNNRACPGSTCQSAFHTYRFEWDRSITPNQFRWYVDATLYHTVNENQVDATTWSNMTSHAGYFILLNVAMGGAFPAAFGGGPTASTVPGRPMLVDYVAVWTRNGAPPTTTSPTTTPPTTTPPCGQIISQGRPATASSVEATNLGAGLAVDGNTGTRWSSAFSDPQWIRVDLGSSRAINRVRLNWEAAYATTYQIQTSPDGSTWTARANITGGNGGIDDLSVSATARYVRMLGTQRATPYGYSLWEFEVYGGCGTTPPPTTSPPPTTPPGGTSAYSTIQAEAFSQQQGVSVQATTDTGGGQNIGNLANGDWALYGGVNFGTTPARTFRARVASGASGGVSGLVQVRLGSPTAAVVGEFAIANTGGWQVWQTVPGSASGITGTHNVYLTFTSGQPADFVNVNWFTFAT